MGRTDTSLSHDGQIHIAQQHVNCVISHWALPHQSGHVTARKLNKAFINLDLNWCFITVLWEVDVFEQA